MEHNSELKKFLDDNSWIADVLKNEAVVFPRDKEKVPYLIEGLYCETDGLTHRKGMANKIYDFILMLSPYKIKYPIDGVR